MIGLVGKLPAHGDFVRRGGPAPVLAALDRWLDTELGRAPELAERIDVLDGWRFAVRLEEQDVLGVMVASEDAVGRRFPLVATASEVAERDAADRWAEAAARVLTEARDLLWRADDVIAALDAEPLAKRGDEQAAGWWRADGRRMVEQRLPTGEAFAGLFGEAAR